MAASNSISMGTLSVGHAARCSQQSTAGQASSGTRYPVASGGTNKENLRTKKWKGPSVAHARSIGAASATARPFAQRQRYSEAVTQRNKGRGTAEHGRSDGSRRTGKQIGSIASGFAKASAYSKPAGPNWSGPHQKRAPARFQPVPSTAGRAITGNSPSCEQTSI